MRISSQDTVANRINRSLLPNPAAYYSQYFKGLRKNMDWVRVRCPFHDDSTPSMSINLKHGGFICHGGCGSKGDLIKFHMQINKVNFVEACKQLGVWL